MANLLKKSFGLGVGIFSVCVRERVFKGDIGFVVLEYYKHIHTHTHTHVTDEDDNLNM